MMQLAGLSRAEVVLRATAALESIARAPQEMAVAALAERAVVSVDVWMDGDIARRVHEALDFLWNPVHRADTAFFDIGRFVWMFEQGRLGLRDPFSTNVAAALSCVIESTKFVRNDRELRWPIEAFVGHLSSVCSRRAMMEAGADGSGALIIDRTVLHRSGHLFAGSTTILQELHVMESVIDASSAPDRSAEVGRTDFTACMATPPTIVMFLEELMAQDG